MDSRVRHPRVLIVARIVLYVSVAIAIAALLGVAVSFLGFLTVLGTLSALAFGDGPALAVVALGGIGSLLIGGVGFVVVTGARRLDRFLLRTAHIPDPLEALTTRYVDGEFDEDEFERRVERVLAVTSRPDDRIAGLSAESAAAHDARRPVAEIAGEAVDDQ